MPTGVEYFIDPVTGKVVLTTAGGTVTSPIAGSAAGAEGAGIAGFNPAASVAGFIAAKVLEGIFDGRQNRLGGGPNYGPYDGPGAPGRDDAQTASPDQQAAWQDDAWMYQLPNGNWVDGGVEVEQGNPVIHGADAGTPGIVQTEYPTDSGGGGGGGSESGVLPDGWLYPNEEILTDTAIPVDVHENPDGSTVVIYDTGAEQWYKAPEDFSQWPDTVDTTQPPAEDPLNVDIILGQNNTGVTPTTTPTQTPDQGTETGTGGGLGSGTGRGSGTGEGSGDGAGSGAGEGDGEGDGSGGTPMDLLALLQGGTRGTEVKGPEGADIPYVYDWESIFANPIQEAYYTSPYDVERGMGQRQLMELIASMRG